MNQKDKVKETSISESFKETPVNLSLTPIYG